MYGKDIYASGRGNDTPKCGSFKHPCRTLHYSVSKTSPNDTIHLDSGGGPFTPSDDYTSLPHSLVIQADSGKATIQCRQGNQSRLFNISESKANAPISVTLQRLFITGCVDTRREYGLGNSLVWIRNAQVKINDCLFKDNGVLFHHPQVQDPQHCSQTQLTIAGSSFTNNGIMKPFLPGIRLAGCSMTNLRIQSSELISTAIQVYAEQDLRMNIGYVLINGQNLRAASMDVTLGSATNQVVIHNSNITGHHHSQTSAVTIAMNKPAKTKPNINLTGVRFVGNTQTRSQGGAISVLSRFPSQSPNTVNVDFAGCSFVGNTARDVGGAAYFYNVGAIKMNQCSFINNVGHEGGAILSHKGWNFTITNSDFHRNAATSSTGRGGAIRAVNSGLQINQCSFTGNTALFEGTALSIEQPVAMSVMQSEFEGKAMKSEGIFDTMISLRSCEPSIRTTFIGNKINLTEAAEMTALLELNQAELNIRGNQVWCPVGHTVHYSNKGDKESEATQLTAWCKPCRPGTYSLEQQVLPTLSLPTREGISGECKPCPSHANCTGAQLKPCPGYWGLYNNKNQSLGGMMADQEGRNDSEINLYLCPSSFCNNQDDAVTRDSDTNLGSVEGSLCNKYDCCRGKRTGKLCGTCDIKLQHQYSLATDTCVAASNCRWKGKKMPLIWCLVFTVVYTVILTILSLCCPTGCPPTQNNTSVNMTREEEVVPQREDSPMSSDHEGSPEPTSFEADESSETYPMIHQPLSDLDSENQEGNENVASDVIVYNELLDEMRRKALLRIQSACVICLQSVMAAQILIAIAPPEYEGQGLLSTVLVTLESILNLRVPFMILDASCFSGKLGSAGHDLIDLASSGFMLAVVGLIIIGGVLSQTCFKWRPNLAHKAQDVIGRIQLATGLLVYVPILRACFRLLHCVQLGDELVLYRNGVMNCYQPWQIALFVILVLMVIPGAPISWVRKDLVKQDHTAKAAVLNILCFLLALPLLLYWVVKSAVSMLVGISDRNDNSSTERENGTRKVGTLYMVLILLGCFAVVALVNFLNDRPMIRVLTVAGICLLLLVTQFLARPFTVRCLNRFAEAIMVVLVVASLICIPSWIMYELGTPKGMLGVVMDWIFRVLLCVFAATLLSALLTVLILASKMRCSRNPNTTDIRST